MKAVAIGLIVSVSSAARADAIDVTADLGFARAPFDAPALSEAKGHGFVIVVEGSYELAHDYVASVRLPAFLGSVAQPAGAYADRAVLGNPQLGIARRMLARGALAILAGLEIGAPLAGHDEDLLANRALAIANGIEGRGAPELFTPGRLPITALGELAYAVSPWRFDASVRLPLLVRVSDDDMPGSSDAVAVSLVLHAQARRRLTARLTAGVSTQIAIDRAQDLERASLAIDVGHHAELELAFQAALGGSTFGGGIHLAMHLP